MLKPERRWRTINDYCALMKSLISLLECPPLRFDTRTACRRPEHKLLKDSFGPAQVWLKHDLRLDDHPGIQQATQEASTVVPFFSIAPELYTHLLRTPNGVEGACCSCMQ